MKPMKKHLILLFAAACAAALILAGCSKKSDEEADAGDTQSSVDEITEVYARIAAEQETIDALDPHRPDDMGEVISLNYKGLSFETPAEAGVTDDTVREYVETYMLPYTRIEVTDRVVGEGDTVNISYVGRLDGEEFEGGSSDGYDLVIGSGTFIDGFEEGLIGAETGETRVLDLTFPENYSNTELAGRETEFTVTVLAIYRNAAFEEFDDDIVSELSGGEYISAENYLEDLREYLELNAKASYNNSLVNNAIDAALKVSEVVPNEETVEWQLDVSMSNYETTLENYWGTTLAYYLYSMGTDYESFRADLRDGAEEGAKQVILVYAICDEEGISINDETKQTYIDAYGYTMEDLGSYLDEENQEIAIKWYLAGQAICETADITFTENG